MIYAEWAEREKMALIPAFEVGLWNAWIFVVYHFIPPLLLALVYEGSLKRSASAVPYTKTEKRIHIFQEAISYLAIIYSIFLPLKLGTIWFYIGLPICLFALIMYTIACVNFATTPIDEPATKGLYRYSRHPLYFTFFLIFIGVGVASASWLVLLFSIIFIILTPPTAIPEERFCLEKYGDAYRKYMNKTPRLVGVPKPGKK